MILSMTGFGRAVQTFADKTVSVEIRSLNSKMTDLRLKIPSAYRERELDLRKIILDFAERGKIEATITVRSENAADGFSFNKSLFLQYAQALSEAADEAGLPKTDIVQAIMRIPAVVSSDEAELPEEEWLSLQQTLQAALQQFQAFRVREGAIMEADMRQRIESISEALNLVQPFEKSRIEKTRQRIQQQIDEILGKEQVDANRLEQEMIYYIEKMDISEEKLRLEEHCRHFLTQLKKKDSAQGRSLNFIAQEIGREVNTLGAKAYSADIQKLVISMKDELEKIKEVVANLV